MDRPVVLLDASFPGDLREMTLGDVGTFFYDLAHSNGVIPITLHCTVDADKESEDEVRINVCSDAWHGRITFLLPRWSERQPMDADHPDRL